MAHFAKFSREAATRIVRHNERCAGISYGASRVDASRTSLNYELFDEHGGGEERLTKRLNEVYVRNDATLKPLVDCVITVPNDGSVQPGEERRFFEACARHLDACFDAKNRVGAWVHLDETTPHMHYAFVPVVMDKGKKHAGREKVAVSQLLTPRFLKSFHKDLKAAIEADFGGRRIGVVSEETERLGRSSRVYEASVDDLKAAQAKQAAAVKTPAMKLSAAARREAAVEAAADVVRRAAQADALEAELKKARAAAAKAREETEALRLLAADVVQARTMMKIVQREAPDVALRAGMAAQIKDEATKKKQRKFNALKQSAEYRATISVVQKREKAMHADPALRALVTRFGWDEGVKRRAEAKQLMEKNLNENNREESAGRSGGSRNFENERRNQNR